MTVLLQEELSSIRFAAACPVQAIFIDGIVADAENDEDASDADGQKGGAADEAEGGTGTEVLVAATLQVGSLPPHKEHPALREMYVYITLFPSDHCLFRSSVLLKSTGSCLTECHLHHNDASLQHCVFGCVVEFVCVGTATRRECCFAT